MLDFIFNPLLVFEPVVAVTIFAVIVLILINLCYRFLVNQQESKQLKEKTKELNKQLREEQKQGNTARTSELMKEMMTENSRLMKMTMKPMLVSFVVIILLLPWLHNNFGDQTIALDNNNGNITIDNELYTVSLEDSNINVLKGSTSVVSVAATSAEEDRRFKIGSNYYIISYESGGGLFSSPESIKLAKVVAIMPEGVSLPMFGSEFGWLGWYLIVSIPFVMFIRKILKIST